MAEIMVFHHVQGLTDGVLAWAEELRAAGHRVHIPDLFAGRTFGSIAEGMAHVDALGFGEVLESGMSRADSLPDEVFYVGFSLGAAIAQKLAMTRAGAKGAVLLHACVSPEFFGEWPAGLPAQIHGMADDLYFASEGDLAAAEGLALAEPAVELFVYPGEGHLFLDPSTADWDKAAAELATQRILHFLAR